MTCIAYRDGFIVAEQRISGNRGLLMGTDEKIVSKLTEDHGLYIGMSGDCGLEDEITAYIFNDLITKQPDETLTKIKEKHYGSDEKAPKAYALAVLKSLKTGAIDVYSYDERLLRLKAKAPFFAEGCGYLLAYGAMAAGASAWEAVNVACKFDANCGYPIDGYDVNTGRYYIYETEAEFRQHHRSPTEAVQGQLALRARSVPKLCECAPEPLLIRYRITS